MSKPNLLKRTLAVAISFTVIGAFMPATLVSAQSVKDTCVEKQISVSLTPGETADQTIVGDFCDQSDTQYWGDNLVIFVHGATANRSYWDLEYNNGQYSAVDAALNRGYSVFNMDSIGSGDSSKPNGLSVTLDATAYTLEQVSAEFRADFDNIVVVGHSFGSLSVAIAASQYPSLADGIVLTGFAHNFSPEAAASNNFWPATMDPDFANSGLDTYLTTVPGTRAVTNFSSLIDPALISLDEATKDVVPMGLLDPTRLFTTETQAITADVLILNGSKDFIFCGGAIDCSNEANLEAHEAPFFTNAASFDARLLNEAGHAITWHYHGQASTAIILSWAQNVFI